MISKRRNRKIKNKKRYNFPFETAKKKWRKLL